MDFKSGFKSTAACSHCQDPKGDLMHLLWCCPVFEHCRTEVRRLLGDIQVSSLPTSLLLYGLTPPLVAANDGKLHLGQDGDSPEFPEQVVSLFSRQPEPNWCTISFVSLATKGPTPLPDSDLSMPRVDDSPASQPDMFTDGSVLFPADPARRFGGIGIALEEGEQGTDVLGLRFPDFVVGDGPRRGRCAPLCGPHATSSRAEGVAILCALNIPRPMNIGCDSSVAVSNMKRVIERVGRLGGPALAQVRQSGESFVWHSKQWALRADGDVWAQVEHLVRQRSAKAQTITKVKAHCTRQQMEGGEVTEKAWIGNAIADIQAGEGSVLCYPWRKSLFASFTPVVARHLEAVHAIQLSAVS
eukprot:732127-Alexandrium_andersonii.AAC.1